MKEESAVPPVWLCWFTCLGGLAAYLWAQGDPVTSAVVTLVAVTGLAGYCLGGAVVVAFLAAMTLCVLFATRLAAAFGPLVGDYLGTTNVLNNLLAVCLGCIAISFVAMLIIEIFWNRLLEKRGDLKTLNHTIGLSLGALQGGLLSWMLLGAVVVAQPHARYAANSNVENVHGFVGKCTANSVVRVGTAFGNSPLIPYVVRLNPFDRVPSLARLHQVPVEADRQPHRYATHRQFTRP